MPDTFIITGAAGFIGSHLSRALLARGHHVLGIDNFDRFYDRALKEANLADLPTERFDLIEADICDGDRMLEIFRQRTPQAVFHIAALAGVRPSIAEPARYAAVNVGGLVNVLQAARESGCRNILFASSSSVYGNRSSDPFSEDDDISAPISPYAATKCAGEAICHTYSHLFGFSIAALRFFTVYGPGQRPDLAISKFMRGIAAGEEIPRFGDGSTSRDYTFIDDIIAGVLAAHERVSGASDGFFRVYNLGGSSPVTLSELIERIGEVVGIMPRVREMPMQPGDVERTCADVSRSAAELGFAPTTGLNDGLARQWSWMKDNPIP